MIRYAASALSRVIRSVGKICFAIVFYGQIQATLLKIEREASYEVTATIVPLGRSTKTSIRKYGRYRIELVNFFGDSELVLLL